jgi:cytochrome c oxidase subunit III
MTDISAHSPAPVSHVHAPKRTKAQIAHENNTKFAVWLYLGSEVVIFAIFIGAYAVFRYNNAEVAHHVHEVAGGVFLVAINTFLLLASSWAMVMGLRSIQMGNKDGLIRWIGATAVLGAVFVGLQGFEYFTLSNVGVLMTPGAEFHDFAEHFYPPTFFHGLHVVVGVLWALRVIWRARGNHYSATNYLGVETFGLYWHFVDVVWIVLFTVIYLW